MSDLHLDSQSKPTTPSSGSWILFHDTTAKIPCFLDDAGRVWASSYNASIASQGAGFATDTYVTNSDILIPSFGVQAKTQIRWTYTMSKTAAGTATPSYMFRIGANRTTADTARLTLTGNAQTAAADFAIMIVVLTFRSIGASGVMQGSLAMMHNGAAAGFANEDAGGALGTSAGFDNSNLGGQYIGMSIDAGASAAWTISQVQVEANW